MKKVIIFLVIALILVAAWLLYRKSKNKSTQTAGSTSSASGSTSTGSGISDSTPLNWNRMLNQGSTGNEVYALQYVLNKAFGMAISVDGSFGPQTAAAIAQYRSLPVSLAQLWDSYLVNTLGPHPANYTIGQLKSIYA